MNGKLNKGKINVCMIGENEGGVCDKVDLTNTFYYGKIFQHHTNLTKIVK